MKRVGVNPIIYLGGIVATFTLTIALMVMVLRPPLSELILLAIYMSLTGIGSAVIGFVAHWAGWSRRLGSLHVSLIMGYILAAALTMLNIWVTMRLMFINEHDVVLGVLLLLFAGGISVSFGYFFSGSLIRALTEVANAADQIADGDLSTRVDDSGNDEVAGLARTFNMMAARLERMAAEQETLDRTRRNLVAWASHDLRTPLSTLRAMIDALVDGVVDDEETIQRYLRQSQGEIDRMSTLIDDLFDLAQLDTGQLNFEFESASLSDLISDTLAAFSAQAKAKQVALSGSVETGVDPVWMATDKIGRVLANLLENAVRYTPAGGTITIEVLARDNSIEVYIRDTGSGVDPVDLPYIFDDFYRGEKSRSRSGYASGGAGLGLAIAQRLVEAHSGTIQAHSIPGQGTTLCFTLPRHHVAPLV